MPLLVPASGTRNSLCRDERAGNLQPRPTTLQYSTPKRTLQAARETAATAPLQNGRSAAIPSGLHVDGLAVKPDGIRRNRTFLAANEALSGIVHNSRAENREFFPNRPPSDGPRRRPPLDAPAHVGGNGTIVRGGAACHAPSPDSDEPPPTQTICAPPFDRRRCSTAIEGEPDKTTSRNPLIDRFAGEQPCDGAWGPLGLAFSEKNYHAEEGPRELLLPTVKSRSGTIHSPPGRS